MLISTEQGTGQIVSAKDDTRFFDDLGCLIAEFSSRVQKDSAYSGTPFVKLSNGWADARSAWFAHPADAHTAMGSGLVAFATADEARRADADGRALSWDEVRR